MGKHTNALYNDMQSFSHKVKTTLSMPMMNVLPEEEQRKTLLEKGTTSLGCNRLHDAAATPGQEQLIQKAIELGIDLLITNLDGETALDVARRVENKQAIRVLAGPTLAQRPKASSSVWTTLGF